MQARPFLLSALGRRARIHCTDPPVRRLVSLAYEAMLTPDDGAHTSLECRIETGSGASPYRLVVPGAPVLPLADAGVVLHRLQDALAVALQELRPDLLFLHAAAIAGDREAFLVAGESGFGKSTTTWALLHQGFAYASDELSAVDLQTLQVFPFAQALCLKQVPRAFPLPEGTIEIGSIRHVPTRRMPARVAAGARPISAVFCLEPRTTSEAPALRRIGAAEAAARLYVSALNALAHRDRGGPAVLRLARNVACYALAPGELVATCEVIRGALRVQSRAVAGSVSPAAAKDDQ